MKIMKTFEGFNTSSADEYIKSTLSKFGLEYEEDIHDDDGNLCIRANWNDDKDHIVYIRASHPEKEKADYHITLLVNGQIEDKYSVNYLDLVSYIRSVYENAVFRRL
jgi:hypothetical protein